MSNSVPSSDHSWSEEEVDELTAAEVLAKLRTVWLNEKLAPNLLDYAAEIVDIMLDQIDNMEDNIRRTPAKHGDVRALVHRMELDRIQYMLKSYLRCRLRKIEAFTLQVLEEERRRAAGGGEEEPLLSPEEATFARDHQASIEQHVGAAALELMPENLRRFDGSKMRVTPNLDHYVFVRMLESVEGVVVEEKTSAAASAGEEVIDLTAGCQYIVRYRAVAHLITSHKAELI